MEKTDYPEIRFGNTMYTFQRDLKVYAVAALNDILHDARTRLYKEAVTIDDANMTIDGGKALLLYQDIEHEILKTGHFPRFIAACVASNKGEMEKLTKEFESLDYIKSRHVFDFFFSGDPVFTVLFPAYSSPVENQDEITPSTDSSTS